MHTATAAKEGFQWLPWVGENYQNAQEKLLIVGESHYDSLEREGDLEYPECIQWFIRGVGVDGPDNPQPLIRNIEKTLFGKNLTDEQKKTFGILSHTTFLFSEF